jgi:hypothetical protein
VGQLASAESCALVHHMCRDDTILLIFLSPNYFVMSRYHHAVMAAHSGGCHELCTPLKGLIIRVISRRSRARLPLANHDDNQHAPNENLRLRHFVNGVSTTLMAVHGLAQP